MLAEDPNQVEDGSTLHLILEGKNLQKGGWFHTTNTFYIVSATGFGPRGSVVWQTVYTSEKCAESSNPRWKEAPIGMESLCKGHLNRPIRITVKHWGEDSKHATMGYLDSTVGELLRASGDSSKMAELQQEGGAEGFGSLVVRHARLQMPRKGLAKVKSARRLPSRALSSPSLFLSDRPVIKTIYSLRSMVSQGTGLCIPVEMLTDHASVFRLTMEGIDLEAIGGWFASTNPFYEIKRQLVEDEKMDVAKREEWKIVHRSEVVPGCLNPIWQSAALPLLFLCRGELDAVLRVSCYSRDDSGKSTPMGSFDTTVTELKRAGGNPAFEFTLKSEDGHSFGTMRAIEASLPEEFDMSCSSLDTHSINQIDAQSISSHEESSAKDKLLKRGADADGTLQQIVGTESTSRGLSHGTSFHGVPAAFQDLPSEVNCAYTYHSANFNEGHSKTHLVEKIVELQRQLDEKESLLEILKEAEAEKSSTEVELSQTKQEKEVLRAQNGKLERALQEAGAKLAECEANVATANQLCSQLQRDNDRLSQSFKKGSNADESSTRQQPENNDSKPHTNAKPPASPVQVRYLEEGAFTLEQLMTALTTINKEAFELNLSTNGKVSNGDFGPKGLQPAIDRKTLGAMLVNAAGQIQSYQEKAMSDALKIATCSSFTCNVNMDNESHTGHATILKKEDCETVASTMPMADLEVFKSKRDGCLSRIPELEEMVSRLTDEVLESQHANTAMAATLRRTESEMQVQVGVIEGLKCQLGEAQASIFSLEVTKEKMKNELLRRREIIRELETTNEPRATTVATLFNLKAEKDLFAERCAHAEAKLQRFEKHRQTSRRPFHQIEAPGKSSRNEATRSNQSDLYRLCKSEGTRSTREKLKPATSMSKLPGLVVYKGDERCVGIDSPGLKTKPTEVMDLHGCRNFVWSNCSNTDLSSPKRQVPPQVARASSSPSLQAWSSSIQQRRTASSCGNETDLPSGGVDVKSQLWKTPRKSTNFMDIDMVHTPLSSKGSNKDHFNTRRKSAQQLGWSSSNPSLQAVSYSVQQGRPRSSRSTETLLPKWGVDINSQPATSTPRKAMFTLDIDTLPNIVSSKAPNKHHPKTAARSSSSPSLQALSSSAQRETPERNSSNSRKESRSPKRSSSSRMLPASAVSNQR